VEDLASRDPLFAHPYTTALCYFPPLLILQMNSNFFPPEQGTARQHCHVRANCETSFNWKARTLFQGY